MRCPSCCAYMCCSFTMMIPFFPACARTALPAAWGPPASYRCESFPMKRATKVSPPTVSFAVSTSRATASAALS